MKIKVWWIILQITNMIISGSDSLISKDYANLISDVYKFTKSSAVCIMHFLDDDNFSQKDLLFKIQSKLGKELLISIINLELAISLSEEEFPDFSTLRKDTNTMSVFWLTSEKDLSRMQKVSKFLTRNEIINLVFFVETGNVPLLEFCSNPDGNPFLLSKEVSLLVKCYEDNFIREWHSLNENEMEVYQRATWEPETGLVLKSGKLILDDLDILKGKIVLSASIQDNVGLLDEYFNDIFLAFGKAGNFTVKDVGAFVDYATYNETTNIWGGAVGSLVNKEVDLVQGFFIFRPEKLHLVDYSEILMHVHYSLNFKKPEAVVLVSWTGFLKPFTLKLWIVIFLSFIIIQTFRVFMKWLLKNNLENEQFVVNDFLYICGMYCQQGLPVFPKISSLRVFYFSISLFTFYILTVYSAGFVSKLSVVDSNIPFKSLEELAKVKSHKLIIQNSVLKDLFQHSEAYPYKDIRHLVIDEPDTSAKCVDMVCQDNIVNIMNAVTVKSVYDKTTIRCPLVKFELHFYTYYGFLLYKNNPYTKGINTLLRKLRSNGTLKKLSDKLFKYKIDTLYSTIDEKNTYESARFVDVAAHVSILLGSILIALIILFFEKLSIGFASFEGQQFLGPAEHPRLEAA